MFIHCRGCVLTTVLIKKWWWWWCFALLCFAWHRPTVVALSVLWSRVIITQSADAIYKHFANGKSPHVAAIVVHCCRVLVIKFCKKRVVARGEEMEFGSKYVYTYTDSEEESVSEDEFETGMDASTNSWYAFWHTGLNTVDFYRLQ